MGNFADVLGGSKPTAIAEYELPGNLLANYSKSSFASAPKVIIGKISDRWVILGLRIDNEGKYKPISNRDLPKVQDFLISLKVPLALD